MGTHHRCTGSARVVLNQIIAFPSIHPHVILQLIGDLVGPQSVAISVPSRVTHSDIGLVNFWTSVLFVPGLGTDFTPA